MKQRFKGLAAGALMAMGTLSAVAASGPDIVFVNAQVITSNLAQPRADAFSLKEGRFFQVGSRDDVLAAAPGLPVIDLQGRSVLPGLIDAHSHAIFAGLASLGPNLEDIEIAPGPLRQRVDDWQTGGDAGSELPFVVSGVNPGAWSNPQALSAQFDKDSWAQRPLLLMGSDYHTAWANQAMRRKAGISVALVRGLAPHERHTIGVLEDGEPSGVLVDAGLDLVTVQLPGPDMNQLLEAARVAVRVKNAYGITAWMDPAANAGPGEALFSRKPGSTGAGILPAYRALSQAGGLTANVAALLVASPQSDAADLDVLDAVREQFQGVPNLSLPGIKIFADGVLEYPAQSAALLGRYHNSGAQGVMLLEDQPFKALVDAADARGWLVHVHALGDRAVRESLDAVAQARKNRDSGIEHSITHLQLVDPDDYRRFAELDVIAVMQLHWAEIDNYLLDLVKPFIAEDDFLRQYPAKSLLNHGAVIAGASDWPISTANPWEAMHNAMTRHGPEGGLNAGERLSREDMFMAYTLNAARTIGLAGEIGSIEPGKQADFIVVDRDLLEVPAEALKETRVLQTYFQGRLIYEGQP